MPALLSKMPCAPGSCAGCSQAAAKPWIPCDVHDGCGARLKCVRGASRAAAVVPQYPSMAKILLALMLVAAAVGLCPAQKRLVLIDQDGSGPGGSNQMAMLALLQAPNLEVLGITMVTGNAWRDEETLHTLRMLELTGHANIPVARGAVFPLVRTEKETRLAEPLNGKVAWLGAWGEGQTTLVETASGALVPVTPAHLLVHGPYFIT